MRNNNNNTNNYRNPRALGLRPRRRNNNQNNNPQNLYGHLNQTRIPKLLSGASPFPPEMTWKLSFVEANPALQSPLTDYALYEYRINGPQSVGGGGSNVVAGFAAMAAIYNAYHVTHVSVELEMVNNEPTFELFAGYIFRDEQPSVSITSGTAVRNALEVAPCSETALLGQPSGMSRYTFPKTKIPVGHILGNPLIYEGSLAYASASTTVPNQIIWLGVLLASPGPLLVLANGAILSLRVTMTTRFYSLKTLQD